ncbi:MAG TPA: hypothetical protein VN648_32190 [Candidatus Methylomirabilis sp.]|nr:hypothetical protein [Candidatus Methylomirabilis sp.]
MLRIDQMMREIESYLLSPMRDADDSWEWEERRSLCELLEQLKQTKAG